MKNLSRFLLLLLAAVTLAACNDDNPTPGPEPEKPLPGENEYGYDGQIEQIRSVYVRSNDTQTLLLLSPQAGLKTFADFTAEGVNYLLFQLDNTLVGKTVDVKTQTDGYLVDNRTGLAAAEFTQFDASSWHTELSQGSFRIAVSAGQAEADFAFTLLSGNVFAGKYKGDYSSEETPSQGDYYAFGDTRSELKSVLAFSLEGMIYMYMSTLEGLSTQEDFTASDNYLLMGVSESLAGQEIDVTTVQEDWAFYNMTPLGRDALETLDPFTWEDVVTAGTMMLTVDGEHATASFSFATLDGGKLFEGTCSGRYVAPPVPSSYTFDGQTVDLKSAFFLSQGGINYLYISPQEGLTTLDEFAEAEYLFIGMDPSLEGQTVDVLTATAYCSFYNMTALGGEEFMGGDSDTWADAITRGEISMSVASQRAVVRFSFTLPSGKLFEGSYDGPYAENTVPEDAFLFIDGEDKPVRAAFYEKSSDGVAFYLTPGAIESARDLEDVVCYVRLYVGNALLNQSEVDIQTTNLPFEFTYVDNFTGERTTVENGDTQGASGYFTVMEQAAENSFHVEFEMDGLGAHLISGVYIGDFALYDLSVPNQYVLGEETPTPIRSALLDKSDAACYAFYFSDREGIATVAEMQAADPVVCYLKPDQLTGRPIGFSFAPEVRIVFRGVSYDQASTSGENGLANGGNIAATLEGDQATVDFNLYFIKEYQASLTGHYAGSVVVVN